VHARLARLLCGLALAGPLVALAQASGTSAATGRATDTVAAGAAMTVRAKLVELDTARRTAVLRGPDGTVVTVDVPESVKNFDQVRVGDDLVIRYRVAIASMIKSASEGSGIRERVESMASASAPAGGLPGVQARRTVEVLAVLQKIDRQARTATLQGAKRSVTLSIPPDIDLEGLKEGDEVRAVFVEAAVLSVERTR
jgi:Cu/Ag efflux protein CusF